MWQHPGSLKSGLNSLAFSREEGGEVRLMRKGGGHSSNNSFRASQEFTGAGRWGVCVWGGACVDDRRLLPAVLRMTSGTGRAS